MDNLKIKIDITREIIGELRVRLKGNINSEAGKEKYCKWDIFVEQKEEKKWVPQLTLVELTENEALSVPMKEIIFQYDTWCYGLQQLGQKGFTPELILIKSCAVLNIMAEYNVTAQQINFESIK